MSNLEIVIVNYPDDKNWGTFQIQDLSNTFFRFDYKNGIPIIDDSLFVNKPGDTQHLSLSPESGLYKGVQKALNEHLSKIR